MQFKLRNKLRQTENIGGAAIQLKSVSTRNVALSLVTNNLGVAPIDLTKLLPGSYTCQITGSQGSTFTSDAAALTVLAIQTQPQPQTTAARGSATFSVVVEPGSGVPGYTYQWKYKGDN